VEKDSVHRFSTTCGFRYLSLETKGFYPTPLMGGEPPHSAQTEVSKDLRTPQGTISHVDTEVRE
jgi:hypothetical protein